MVVSVVLRVVARAWRGVGAAVDPALIKNTPPAHLHPLHVAPHACQVLFDLVLLAWHALRPKQHVKQRAHGVCHRTLELRLVQRCDVGLVVARLLEELGVMAVEDGGG